MAVIIELQQKVQKTAIDTPPTAVLLLSPVSFIRSRPFGLVRSVTQMFFKLFFIVRLFFVVVSHFFFCICLFACLCVIIHTKRS